MSCFPKTFPEKTSVMLKAPFLLVQKKLFSQNLCVLSLEYPPEFLSVLHSLCPLW